MSPVVQQGAQIEKTDASARSRENLGTANNSITDVTDRQEPGTKGTAEAKIDGKAASSIGSKESEERSARKVEAAQTKSAEISIGTKFRGIWVGMTRAEIENSSIEAFTGKLAAPDAKAHPCVGSQEASCQLANSLGLFKQQKKFVFTSKITNRICAEAIFDQTEIVERLQFDKCFFGANDMEFQPFAQAIVNNYGVTSMSCKSDLDSPLAREYAAKGIGPSNPRTCSGLAKTGEKVTISTGGIMQSDMIVEKPSARPSFN